MGLIPRLVRCPGGGHGSPLQYSYLENPHEQRSLAGYSPCSHKESGTTERLSTAHNVVRENNACQRIFKTTSHSILSQSTTVNARSGEHKHIEIHL